MAHRLIAEVLAPVVPDVVVIVGGMLALLLVLALALVVSLFKHLFSAVSDVPLIGSHIRDALNSAADALWGLAGWLWAHCNPVAVWNATVNIMGSLWADYVVRTFESVYSAITARIPQLINAAVQWVLGEALAGIAVLRAWTAAAFSAVYSTITTVEGALASEIATAERGVISWATATIAGVEATIIADVDSVAHYAQSAVAALEGDLSRGLGDLETWTLGELRAIDNVITTTVAGVEAWVVSEVAAVTAPLIADLGNIRDFLLREVVPATTAAAAVATAVRADFDKFRRDCGDPMCSGLSQILNDLTGISSILGDVAIAGLLAELVHNPQGVANELHDLVVQPVSDAVSAVYHDAGVAA